MRDTLGEFEQMVLLAILHLGEDVYGVPIVDEIARRTGREVAPAAVYVTLRRLEEKGMLASWVLSAASYGRLMYLAMILAEPSRLLRKYLSPFNVARRNFTAASRRLFRKASLTATPPVSAPTSRSKLASSV